MINIQAIAHTLTTDVEIPISISLISMIVFRSILISWQIINLTLNFTGTLYIRRRSQLLRENAKCEVIILSVFSH